MKVKEFKERLEEFDENKEIVVEVYAEEYNRYDLYDVDFIGSPADDPSKVIVQIFK